MTIDRTGGYNTPQITGVKFGKHFLMSVAEVSNCKSLGVVMACGNTAFHIHFLVSVPCLIRFLYRLILILLSIYSTAALDIYAGHVAKWLTSSLFTFLAGFTRPHAPAVEQIRMKV